MNPVSDVTERVVQALDEELSPKYTGLVVRRSLFRPAALPTFDRYAVIVTPTTRPWNERRVAIAMIQYTVRLDLYVLVKNYTATDDSPMFGTDTVAGLGIFELVHDLKKVLRFSNLAGLLDKTYDEPGGDANSPGQGGGDLDFQETIPGFDAAEYAFVHRVRVPYVARLKPFCHDRQLPSAE